MPSRKGSPNRNKNFLMSRLQDMYGKDFHPIMKLAENAHKLDAMSKDNPDTATIKASVTAWDLLAQYTEPKLKAVEISNESELVVSVQRKNYSAPDDLNTETDTDE